MIRTDVDRQRWPDWPDDRSFPRLRDAFITCKKTVALIFSLGFASIALNIMATLLIAQAIDRVLGQDGQPADNSAALRFCGAAILAYAAGGALWITQGRVTIRFVHRLANRIRHEADDLVRSSRLIDVERFGPIDIHGRLTNDVETLTRALQGSVSQFSNSLILTVGLVAVMSYLSVTLAVVTIATVAIGVLLTRKITALARPRYGTEFSSVGLLNASIIEWLGADTSTRAMLRRADHTKKLDGLAADASRASFRAQRLGGQAQPISLVVSYAGYIAVIMVGVHELRGGRITVGTLQAMLLYARQVAGPLFQLATLSNLVQSGLASWNRVAELGRLRPVGAQPVDTTAAVESGPIQVDRVALDNVSLAYTPDSDALINVDLTLQKGEVVFLIGETGSGKSTLGAVIAGLYTPDRGQVQTGEVDLPRYVAYCVSYVPQNAYLFRGTIEENVLSGDSGSEPLDLRIAADQLGLARLVNSSGEGFGGGIDVGGRDLPLAKRQAISLLRAYCAARPVVVLDEAMSALDVATEELVLSAFRRRCRDQILVVVIHRHDNIGPDDRVVRVADGAVVGDLRGRDLADQEIHERRIGGPTAAGNGNLSLRSTEVESA